jgi:MFS family permease
MGSSNTPPTEGAVEAEVVLLPFAPLGAAVVVGAGAGATWTTATPVMAADPPRAGEVDPEDETVATDGGGEGVPLATVGGTVGGTVGVVWGTVVGAVVVDRGGWVVVVVLGTVLGMVLAGRVIGEAMSSRAALWKDVS